MGSDAVLPFPWGEPNLCHVLLQHGLCKALMLSALCPQAAVVKSCSPDRLHLSRVVFLQAEPSPGLSILMPLRMSSGLLHSALQRAG